MRRLSLIVCSLATSLLTLVSPVFGQATTGTISGRVTSSDGQPLPGVTVVAASPSLQGVRTVLTSDSGDYLIPVLPPGTYSVSYELSGFQTAKRTQLVATAYNAAVDVTLRIESVSEAVTVVADAQPLGATALVATNFKQDLMSTLPSNRTIDAVMLMAPSVHATGPRGAFTIAGAQSYENLYLLNGAVIVENLRGSAYPLYIEDALQEVTVATAGVSAEYGRFTGGMVSAVTKSGGNVFSGSLRTTLANDHWRALTPHAHDPKRSTDTAKPATNPMWEGTFGGPIARERLWFFAATRIRNEETSRKTFFTELPYIRTNDEKRYEGKLTYTPRAAHSVQASYIKIAQEQTNFTSQIVMDLESLAQQRQPADLMSLRYSGLLTPNLSVEALYSSRHLTLNTGASTRDRVRGTLIQDSGKNARYWSPTFCSVCGDEKRDNDDFFAKGSYFLPSRALGAHQLVVGYDRFNDKIFQNAYASGSDYRIQAAPALRTADGKSVVPQFIPNATLIVYTPVEKLTKGSNLRMHSVFANDLWRLNKHVTFNLGLRWDKNDGEDGGGEVVANRGLLSPRLAAIWDPRGNGQWTLNTSYARYAMPMTSNVAASTTSHGNASLYAWVYQGPAINADSSSLLTTEAALTQLFDWFDQNGGQGRGKAGAFVPGFNVRILSPLKSPNADEYVLGSTLRLGSRGTLRVDGMWRRYHDFYSQSTDAAADDVFDAAGSKYDLFVVENTNEVTRRYSGLTTQFSYRMSDRFDVGGNYTLSRTWGNFDGETAGSGPAVAQVAAFREYKRREWNSPEGDLAADQRHRARFWGTYASPVPRRVGSLVFALLQQMGSGVPYGAVSGVNANSFIQNPGYVSPQAPLGTVDYYFAARDAFRTENTYRTDVAINYGYQLRTGGSQPELFFHGEILNIFNQSQLCGCGATAFGNGGAVDIGTIGTAVRTPRNSPAGTFQTFNPFTTTPVQGTHWELSTDFGKALSHLAYTTPRLFRFSVGIRF